VTNSKKSFHQQYYLKKIYRYQESKMYKRFMDSRI